MIGSEFKTEYNDALQMEQSQAHYDGFMVSFLPWYDQGMGPDSKDGETALYHRATGRYYILNGDWRLAYSEIASQGFDACLTLFKLKAPQFISSWSNRP